MAIEASKRFQATLDEPTRLFYCHTLTALIEAGVPFLVGGAYALQRYTGVERHTKDLDVCLREADCQAALDVLAALADIHCGKLSRGRLRPIFDQASARADVLLLCGDLTDHGLPEEAGVLAKELSGVKIPILAILGNHDYESDQPEEVIRILGEAGVTTLDGDAVEIRGIGFTGVKGFGGGFGPRALSAWGEPMIKQFVHEAVNEALKLESGLARLRTDRRVALLHYAPIPATVAGEPLEIYPFVGSSRLEDPLTHFPVDVVFHGHAHSGSVAGRLANGVPVYNVAAPLLARAYPDQPPFRLHELTFTTAEEPAISR